jgi:murein tripeptide amidase MpaA
MKRWTIVACAFVAVLALSGSAPGAGGRSGNPLDMYRATLDAGQVAKLRQQGYDVASVRQSGAGTQVDLVLSAGERERLASQGIKLGLIKNGKGQTVRQQAELMAADGYTVYRSYDERGGIRDELYSIARRNPGIVKLKVIGKTVQGREIIALKVTKDAKTVADGARPDVLYMGTIHAREWIATEVVRRELNYFVSNYGKNAEVTNLVNSRELWFIPVSNPDGYQYTFDHERFWRKNLRDNNGDGQIAVGDGVDLNRNFDITWGYDEEGSSSQISSDTFRGTGPASEPETQAHQKLINDQKFKFLVTYHSYGPLLLYAYGWQIQTPSADDPLFVAYTGTDANPAVPGFDPGVGADLYITNGTTDDYSYSKTGALSWTPELEEGCVGCGFAFPDDESLVQAQFAKNLPFALDLAKSAPNPANPVSHLGNTAKPFYLDMGKDGKFLPDGPDPEKTNNPMSDFTFAVSYGDPQPVRVLAKRDLNGDGTNDAVSLNYQITRNGVVQPLPDPQPTSEWNGGERGEVGDFYYHVMEGAVTGTQPGDSVKVWFTGGGQTSDSFTYTAKVESSNRVLVMAAEDYTGLSPVYKSNPRPAYLSYYLSSLAAIGRGADVYDVDANGREAPSALGVLSHYDAVIWYTGDDVITREPGMSPGTASRLANDEMLEIRAFLNEGGRVLYTGKYAGLEFAQGYEFNIETNAPCDPNSAADGCQSFSDDFLQYYLGAYLYNENAGTTAKGTLYDVIGVDEPFSSLGWSFGSPSANNQDHSASFITTSGILPKAQFPQFDSWASAKYARPGGPFDPHTGSFYVYSNIADISYKRLTRTIDVPAGGANLSFWISRDTEPDWDFTFVEAHTVGQDDWTTLPDANGHTSTDAGLSCPTTGDGSAWQSLHPFLAHYQTVTGGGDTCSSTGTTGAWNAATGNSGGWQEWKVDLSQFAGKQVEVSITVASDPAVQGLGAWVDETQVTVGGQTTATSFETDDGGWTIGPPPPGTVKQENGWTRTSEQLDEGGVVGTDDTVYAGFGFEGISDAADRNAFMKGVLGHLGVLGG